MGFFCKKSSICLISLVQFTKLNTNGLTTAKNGDAHHTLAARQNSGSD